MDKRKLTEAIAIVLASIVTPEEEKGTSSKEKVSPKKKEGVVSAGFVVDKSEQLTHGVVAGKCVQDILTKKEAIALVKEGFGSLDRMPVLLEVIGGVTTSERTKKGVSLGKEAVSRFVKSVDALVQRVFGEFDTDTTVGDVEELFVKTIKGCYKGKYSREVCEDTAVTLALLSAAMATVVKVGLEEMAG